MFNIAPSSFSASCIVEISAEVLPVKANGTLDVLYGGCIVYWMYCAVVVLYIGCFVYWTYCTLDVLYT